MQPLKHLIEVVEMEQFCSLLSFESINKKTYDFISLIVRQIAWGSQVKRKTIELHEDAGFLKATRS